MLLALAIYGLTLAATDVMSVAVAAQGIGLGGWVLVLGFSLVNYFLRFARWRGYLRVFGHFLPTVPNALYYFVGFAFTTTPGKAGEAVRSFYLVRWGVGVSDSLAALFVERLVDMLAIAFLAGFAIFSFEQGRAPLAAFACLLLLFLPLLRGPGIFHCLERLQRRVKAARLKSWVVHLSRLLRLSARLLGSRPLCGGFVVGLFAWGAEGLGLYLVLKLMEVNVPILLAVGIYATSILIGALSFIPGGLGSTEAAMGLMLHLAGVDLTTAVAATLVCRIATLWFAVLIGLCCLAVLEWPGRGSRLRGGTGQPVEKEETRAA